jgi:DNA-binding transcriptional ArsR family regulator
MALVRLRTRRDAREQAGLTALRDTLRDWTGPDVSPEVLEPLVEAVERKLSARRGWRFIMVEPVLYADIVAWLARHSRRKLRAIELFTRLFSVLPPDSNEVTATREELAKIVGITPRAVSEIMGELEEIGAVYRRRHGREVRYFVNPSLGTHLTGAVRDKAQAEAPKLRLVEPA